MGESGGRLDLVGYRVLSIGEVLEQPTFRELACWLVHETEIGGEGTWHSFQVPKAKRVGCLAG